MKKIKAMIAAIAAKFTAQTKKLEFDAEDWFRLSAILVLGSGVGIEYGVSFGLIAIGALCLASLKPVSRWIF